MNNWKNFEKYVGLIVFHTINGNYSFQNMKFQVKKKQSLHPISSPFQAECLEGEKQWGEKRNG
jgi:hypothetical protein